MGESVLPGIGVGTAAVSGPVARMGEPLAPPAVDAVPAGPAAEERARALAALAEVAAELDRRAVLAGAQSPGGEAQSVLEAQAMMAEDPSLAQAVADRTEAGRTAERALFEAFGQFREQLAQAGEYLAARVADLDDLAARAIAAASGVPMPGVPEHDTPFVLVAKDLAPADTALLDLTKVLALVTAEGGPTSHTAILARSRGIPAVVGVRGALDLAEGTEVVVDAAAGQVVAHPSAQLLAEVADRARTRQTTLAATDKSPGRTSDGVEIKLLANVGGTGDLAAAQAAGAEGVGLFRTEFLYLGSDTPPSFKTQVDTYRAVLDGFPGQRVVVRTLDAGADKPLPFLPLGDEPNPALGVRGLRAFRGEHQTLLETQLRALAAAGALSEADLWVMAPMVADEEDSRWFVELARSFGLERVGVMVEVPSAALCADAVLAVTDFASIGTNDLTQYTLAADRMLGSLGPLQDPWHPAVLRLVELTGTAGAAAGKSVGVCGEAAADPKLALVLVGLGITSLSMAPGAIAEVRASLAGHTLADCQRLAVKALRRR
jgi:phosphoenolpyruvate-protein phosphotransferase (PTS system enzyme I)